MSELARLLDDAARGCFPPPNGEVDIVPRPEALTAAVFSFTAHLVVAASVEADALRAVAPPGDFAAWGRVPSWLGARAGVPVVSGDVMLAAIADGDAPAIDVEPADGYEHPRVERASRYRDAVRTFVTSDECGVLTIGRGVAGRYELAFEVEPDARQRGLGRALAATALTLVPAGEAVWAQVHPGNAASLRAVLAAGFVPIGHEQLIGPPRGKDA